MCLWRILSQLNSTLNQKFQAQIIKKYIFYACFFADELGEAEQT